MADITNPEDDKASHDLLLDNKEAQWQEIQEYLWARGFNSGFDVFMEEIRRLALHGSRQTLKQAQEAMSEATNTLFSHPEYRPSKAVIEKCCEWRR
jgi:hypothetical protein